MTNNTIRTDERIFLVNTRFDYGKKILCNLNTLEETVKNAVSVSKIEHFLNYKFKKISKKDLKAILESEKLSTAFVDTI